MKVCLTQAKKIIYLVLFFMTIGTSPLWAVKSASIVICAHTGAVLHQANADAITHPASLTKMMTLYLTFKALREKKLIFDKSLPVSKHASLAAPCKLWLKAGSTIAVRQAILALVTKSANDAAIALAEALGKGSEVTFAKTMTATARKLGMRHTVFKNAHGLPNKQQVTTARDMATLSLALYRDFPEYYKFFKEQKFVYKGQVHLAHNKLLGKVKGVDGIKTGFVNASGFNLAASMVRGDKRVIAVVMGGETSGARDKKMVKLLEASIVKISGKKEKGQTDASIDDLIHEIEKPKIQTAVYRASHKQHIKKIDAQASIDDILKDLEKGSQQIKIKKPKNKLKSKNNMKKKKKKKRTSRS